jgi:ethanolamine utilization microcompartment shell protein EutS
VLGNPNGARALQRAVKGNTVAVAEVIAKADRHAQDVLPIIDDIRSAGIFGLRSVATELNARGILTADLASVIP